MRNLLVWIALSFVLAACGGADSPTSPASSVHAASAAAVMVEQKIQRFRPDEVAVLFVMGQSNSAGLNGLPANFVLTGASGTGSSAGGMPAPNVWGIRNDGWGNIAGNADGPGAPFTQPISAIDQVAWVNWSDSTSSDMNLGYYGGSGNAANFAAYAWQSAINAGEPLLQAAVEAAIARLRPILMTSFAFILGVAPLVIATGAGASARKSIGITVFSGMIASTCLAVLFVPSLFVVIQRFEEWRAARKAPRIVPAE